MTGTLARAADMMEAAAWWRATSADEYRRRLDDTLGHARRLAQERPHPPSASGPRSPELQRLDELLNAALISDPEVDPVPLWRAHMAVMAAVQDVLSARRPGLPRSHRT